MRKKFAQNEEFFEIALQSLNPISHGPRLSSGIPRRGRKMTPEKESTKTQSTH
jgi:hypothetical protein